MTTTTQVATPVYAPTTIGELLRDATLADRVQSVAADGYDARRLLREVAADLRAHPAMRACTPASLLIAIVGIASVGLSLAPLAGEVFLVPRRSKRDGSTEATLMIGRNGWLNLALRTGRVAEVYAHCVYKNDKHFSLKLGGGFNVEHEPALENRGEIVAVYAIAELTSGARRGEFMDSNAIAAVRAMADEKSEAWRRFPSMMIEKVAVKRVARLVAGGHPLLVRASAAEGGVMLDVPFPEVEIPAAHALDDRTSEPAGEAPAPTVEKDGHDPAESAGTA